MSHSTPLSHSPHHRTSEQDPGPSSRSLESTPITSSQIQPEGEEDEGDDERMDISTIQSFAEYVHEQGEQYR
jgi:hypothetical protein